MHTMCCSGPSCGNYHCRCICMRCRGCDTCGGDETGFGTGLAVELMTGHSRGMMKKVSKSKPNMGLPPQDAMPKPEHQRPQPTHSQGQGLVNAVKNNCAQQ